MRLASILGVIVVLGISCLEKSERTYEERTENSQKPGNPGEQGPGVPPAPLTGKALWEKHACEPCHSEAKALDGLADLDLVIQNLNRSLESVPQMAQFKGKFSADQIRRLASYLLEAGKPASTPEIPKLNGQALASEHCAVAGCHVTNLAQKKKASPSATVSATKRAIDGGIIVMAKISLTDEQLMAIAQYMDSL